MREGCSGPLSALLGARGPGREPQPPPEGGLACASWDAVPGPWASETVWAQSLLESQVAELMPGHHRSSWKDAVVREARGGGGETVQGYKPPALRAARPALNLSLGSHGISEPQFTYRWQ